MEARLYVVHDSHPCACVMKALELKGVPYRTIEFPPALHAPVLKAMFGERTVPGLKLDGEKVQGSRKILRRLEELRPEPPLFPADPERRAQVEEAERWGDEVFQPLGRRLLWPGLKRRPEAMVGYSRGSRLGLPPAMVRLSAPLLTRLSAGLNRASDDTVRTDAHALPGYLDRIDAWIAAGVLGDEEPNAADLQIGSTLRLLMSVADLRPYFEGRPAAELARRLFPEIDGELPAGTYPAEWLPTSSSR